ncbi:DEAD/DEAH box helicase, partial [Pseudomonas aeruginosa]|nr:DEAD/DEAH box helicase [Pseudomonas aeruginosa]
DIYQNCRDPEEIKRSFEQLQLQLSGEISEAMVKTRQVLLENFDEEVQDKLRIRAADSSSTRNRFERLLLDLTRAELGDYAHFHGESFELHRLPAGSAGGITLGRYELPRRAGNSHLYRLGHPLAAWVINQAKSRRLDQQPADTLVFDYAAYGTRISTLEPLRGQRGRLTLKLFSVEALGNLEQHLVVSAVTNDGHALPEDDPEKLLRLPARLEQSESAVAGAVPLVDDLEQRKNQLLREINQRNMGYFEQEVAKLDAWADDLKLGLEQEIKKIDGEVKELRRIAATAATLEEKVGYQKQQRELEGKRNKLRRELYARQDEIEEERNALIDQLEQQLQQHVREEPLFTVEWVLQ